MTPPINGWSSYEKMVLNRLDLIERDITALDDKVTMLRIDVAQLKVKAGMWGAVAGCVPALVTALVAWGGLHG
jgi:hypothetical protein